MKKQITTKKAGKELKLLTLYVHRLVNSRNRVIKEKVLRLHLL
ncbi:MAG: hypothetical protein N4A62_16825 [Marinisporobacter sp.]|nr:hypothetical protein [Marinisporobacter sp.]